MGFPIHSLTIIASGSLSKDIRLDLQVYKRGMMMMTTTTTIDITASEKSSFGLLLKT